MTFGTGQSTIYSSPLIHVILSSDTEAMVDNYATFWHIGTVIIHESPEYLHFDLMRHLGIVDHFCQLSYCSPRHLPAQHLLLRPSLIARELTHWLPPSYASIVLYPIQYLLWCHNETQWPWVLEQRCTELSCNAQFFRVFLFKLASS